MIPEIQEPERADPVLHGGDHHVAGGGDDVRVVYVESGGAAHVAPAVYPDQHRHLGAFLERLLVVVPDPEPLGHPDVQVEAVLGDVRVRVPHLLALEAGEVLVSGGGGVSVVNGFGFAPSNASLTSPDNTSLASWWRPALRARVLWVPVFGISAVRWAASRKVSP